MDWPVTARTTVPHVRQTEADRELETWLAVDLSASLDFGTARYLKRDLALAAAAAMTHLTVRGGNRIGAVVGSGAAPVRWLAARAGRRHAQGLLRAIAGTSTAPGVTDLGGLVDGLSRPPRRRGLAVVISDCLAPPAPSAGPIRRLAVRHEGRAVGVREPREPELMDPETGVVHEVRTGDRLLRRAYAEAAAAQRNAIAATLREAGVPRLQLRTDLDWLLDMVRYVAGRRHARTRGAAR